MDGTNPIKYSDLIAPDGSIEQLIKQLDQASDAYMNLANNIRQQAGVIEQSLKGVTGATEAGRKSIRESASDADKLEKEYRKLDDALSDNAQKIAELRAISAEQNRINKLTIQMNKSAEGSYNRLSAEYSLLKIQINQLSKEERENNAEAKAMVQRSKEVYEEMKRLQEETGKHQLNVGNYAEAAKELRMELRSLTQQMAAMKLAGEDTTPEYRAMAERAGELRDAMSDASQEVSNMASDTSSLDTILQGAGAASGGFSVAVGAMELFGEGSEDVQEAQKKLQSAIAITTGLQQIQNAVQKQSALMLGVSKVQTLALAKAEAYERLIKIQGTNATIRATVAQKAFNLIANANPYVLLATALISVIGALALFARGSDKASEKQARLNEYQNNYIEYLQATVTIENTIYEARIRNAKNELNIAKARGASIEEIRRLEDELAKQERAQADASAEKYKVFIKNIETYKENISKAREELLKLQERLSQGFTGKVKIDIDGKKTKMKIDEAIAYFQNYIDTTDKKLQIGIQARQAVEDNEQEEREREAQRQKEDAERAKQARKTQTDAVRASISERNKLIKDGYERQRAEAKESARVSIEDIKNTLAEGENLTATARQALANRIKSIEENLRETLRKIDEAEMNELVEIQRKTDEMRLEAMEDGEAKELTQLRASYDARREELEKLVNDESKTLAIRQEYSKQLLLLDAQQQKDEQEIADRYAQERLSAIQESIQMQLDMVTEGSQEELDLRLQLLEVQRQEEIEANRKKAESIRQSEEDINAKYDQKALEARGEFALKQIDLYEEMIQSEIDLMRIGEQKKEKLALELEKRRLDKVLELIRSGQMKVSSEEMTIYENQLKGVQDKLSSLNKFGTKRSGSDEIKDALQESANYTLEVLSSVTEARVKMAESAVEAANKEMESAKATLDAEREAAREGYANNQEMAQKEYELAKENQHKALEAQKKAQKQQQVIDTLSQISSLVTASASMWKDLGWPMALVGIATMWASFAASKIMASKLAKQNTEQYGEGTVELLEGGSHASGNDIDLGRKKDGTRRRAEGGEFFAVINKRSSRRYRRQIPEIINSLNNGTFNQKYGSAFGDSQTVGAMMVGGTATDVSTLETEVRRIREQGENRAYVDSNGNVIYTYKNLTRREKR